MINTAKIKERMKALGITQRGIAKLLGMSAPAVNQKINKIHPTTLDEAKTMASILKIDDNELKEYFFV